MTGIGDARSKNRYNVTSVRRPTYTGGPSYGTSATKYFNDVVENLEQINYFVGKGCTVFRPCEHNKVVEQSLPTGNPIQFPFHSGGRVKCWYEYGNPKWSCPDRGEFLIGGPMYTVANGLATRTKAFGPSESEVDEAIHDAVINVTSRPVNTGPNYAQMVLELKDIPKTVQTVRNLSRFIRGVGVKVPPKSVIDPMGRMSSRQYQRLADWKNSTLGQVADAYLGAVFGIQPTWRDIKNLFERKVSKDWSRPAPQTFTKGQTVRSIKHVGAGSERPKMDVKGSYTSATYKVWCDVPGAFDSSGEFPIKPSAPDVSAFESGLTNPPRPGLAKGWDTAYVETDVTITAFGKVARSVTFEGKPPAMQGADPTSTAWELLPFSFVVDWFANIGKWLQQQNKLATARYGGFFLDRSVGVWVGVKRRTRVYQPIVEVTRLLDVQEPGKVTRRGNSYTGWQIGFPAHYEVETTCRWALAKTTYHYERYRWGDPPSFARMQTKGLSEQGAFQWGSGLALAVQNCAAIRRLLGY